MDECPSLSVGQVYFHISVESKIKEGAKITGCFLSRYQEKSIKNYILETNSVCPSGYCSVHEIAVVVL